MPCMNLKTYEPRTNSEMMQQQFGKAINARFTTENKQLRMISHICAYMTGSFFRKKASIYESAQNTGFFLLPVFFMSEVFPD